MTDETEPLYASYEVPPPPPGTSIDDEVQKKRTNENNIETPIGNLELWMPPKSKLYEDGIPIWEIVGEDAQYVQFPLRPKRSITCFSGAMAYMSHPVEMSTKLIGTSKVFGRLAGGGSFFRLTYTNDSDTQKDGYIAMTPSYPGVIIPINMRDYPCIKAMRSSFLCSTITTEGMETDVSAGFQPAKSFLAMCCSGVDFVMQTIEGGEWSFLTGMGTIMSKKLGRGEVIVVDSTSVLCFEESVNVDIVRVGGCGAMFCSGENVFNTELEGPGRVWLQSMGIDKMRRMFPPRVIKTGGGGGGGGGD